MPARKEWTPEQIQELKKYWQALTGSSASFVFRAFPTPAQQTHIMREHMQREANALGVQIIEGEYREIKGKAERA